MMHALPGPDHRLHPRNNLFVVAALCDGTGPLPVRIRNLSPAGALIEGGALPPVGAEARLTRGPLAVPGRIIWRLGSRAGIRFAAPVRVGDWLPGSCAPGQQQVDEMILRARETPGFVPVYADVSRSPPDFAALAEALDRAGEQLVSDPAVAARHAHALQAVDAAADALAWLAGQPLERGHARASR